MAQVPAVTFSDETDALTQATSAIFSKWTALILTVDHQLGGDPQRVRQMLQATVQIAMSTNPKHTYGDLVDFFYDQFDLMETDVEDDSPEQVASHIIRIRDALRNGDYNPATETVQQLASTPPSHVSRSVTNSRVNDEHEDDDMNVTQINTRTEAPVQSAPSEPNVDADGFTEVTRSGRHR